MEKESNQPQKKKFYFSFSSMTKLMRNPKQFYKEYILGEHDKLIAGFLDIGTLVHNLVLEPETFDDKIVVMSCKTPTDSVKKILDDINELYVVEKLDKDPQAIIELKNYNNEILQALIKHDLYQSLTDSKKKNKFGLLPTGDEKRLEKVITDEHSEYFQLLARAHKKTIVDYKMVEKAKKKADAILSNNRAKVLLSATDDEEIRTELDLRCNVSNYNYGLRGIIDCVKINSKKRKITITDLKTTSKTLQLWKEAFPTSEYMYWLQPIIYKEILLSLITKEVETWSLEVNFVVIDCNDDVYCFKVSVKSLVEWERNAKEVYDKANWHYTTGQYDLPFEFLQNLVEL